MSRLRKSTSLISLLLLLALALAACGAPGGTTSQATTGPAEPQAEPPTAIIDYEPPVETAVAPTEPAATEATTMAPPATEATMAPAVTEAATMAPAATEGATAAPATTGAGGTGEAKGTLTVAVTTFPNSLDVPATSEVNAAMVAWQMYDSLVWVDDTGTIVPALAESWEVSDDGTEYTFKLRDGVTFHNGEPFTADSVVVSWERGSRPEMQFSDR